MEPIKYVFGLKTATFYICPNCGCYVAAIVEHQNKLFSAINTSTLNNELKSLLKKNERTNFGQETRASRKERRLANWTPTFIKSKTLSEQMRIDTLEGFNGFAKQFQDGTLPKNKWTHQAHFVIALWLILRHGVESAKELARSGIKKYNEATGVANTDLDGYHETITMFYLDSVQNFIKTSNDDNEIELLTKLLKNDIIDKNYPLDFYSPEKLFSKEARLSWVQPDLKELLK